MLYWRFFLLLLLTHKPAGLFSRRLLRINCAGSSYLLDFIVMIQFLRRSFLIRSVFKRLVLRGTVAIIARVEYEVR